MTDDTATVPRVPARWGPWRGRVRRVAIHSAGRARNGVVHVADRIVRRARVRVLATRELDRQTVVGQRALVTRLIQESSGGRVGSGPFAGMWISDETSWFDGSLAPKLLGCYEQELHDVVEEVVADDPPVVVNYGCAEGFYAVGFALRLRSTDVVAVDIDDRALTVCTANAVRNGVADRIRAVHPEQVPPEVLATPGIVVIVDVEGDEARLLGPDGLGSLEHATVIVECHDDVVPGITDLLARRYGGTHRIRRLHQGSRDPHQYEVLQPVRETSRWLAVSESRPQAMTWLVLTPLGGADGRPDPPL